MEEVKRASSKTKLKVAGVTIPVSLYKTSGEPAGAPEFERAGPNGNPLHLSQEAAKAATESGSREAAKADALGAGKPRSGSGSGTISEARPYYEEGTLEKVKPDEVRKGIRKQDGEFVDLTAKLQEIEEKTQVEGLEVVGFIRREQVPRERIIGSYFVGVAEMDEKGSDLPPARALSVLRQAMHASGRVAVVRWTKRSVEALGIFTPLGDDLLTILELHWYDKMRGPNQMCLAPSRAEVTAEEVGHAEALIGAMADHRSDLDGLRASRDQMQAELYAAAWAGKLEEVPVQEPPKDAELEDLAPVLKRAAEEAIPAKN